MQSAELRRIFSLCSKIFDFNYMFALDKER